MNEQQLRKDFVDEIRNNIKEEFAKMSIVNAYGEYKYWNPEYFGYNKNENECPLYKYFPAEVMDKVINLLN